MIEIRHDYYLELTASNGTPLARFRALEIDWEPAREWAWWQAVRQGRLSGQESQLSFAIEPVWDAQLGEPHLSCLQAKVSSPRNSASGSEIGISYFQDLASQAAAILVKKQVLATGDLYRYSLQARPTLATTHEAVSGQRTSGPAYSVSEQAPKLTLSSPRSLRELVDAALVCGPHNADDVPVFIPQSLLEEVTAQTEQAGDRETGSILAGHLRRDTEGQSLFAEITLQVPAQHTDASSLRLGFSAQTWTAARNAIALRKQQEQMLGWFHSHPAKAWCTAACPEEKRSRCALGNHTIFSADDHALHRAIFAKAFTTALLLTDSVRGMRYALYGWRNARLERRGFYLLPRKDPERFVAAANEGEPHAPMAVANVQVTLARHSPVALLPAPTAPARDTTSHCAG